MAGNQLLLINPPKKGGKKMASRSKASRSAAAKKAAATRKRNAAKRSAAAKKAAATRKRNASKGKRLRCPHGNGQTSKQHPYNDYQTTFGITSTSRKTGGK